MSRAAVNDILDRIKQLPTEDRRLLDELLAQQEDQEWREEAAKAREAARSQGIDQGGIDHAVYAARHGG
ncbi:MAG TPA: hypothetical protein VLE27_04245 [Thermoanaerobaculia bacterium]|nr:hypothetical protein [Thermoanaerobaculia bacterium]